MFYLLCFTYFMYNRSINNECCKQGTKILMSFWHVHYMLDLSDLVEAPINSASLRNITKIQHFTVLAQWSIKITLTKYTQKWRTGYNSATKILHLIPRRSLLCGPLCGRSFQVLDHPMRDRPVLSIIFQTESYSLRCTLSAELKNKQLTKHTGKGYINLSQPAM